jgi:hypothetical protein
MSMGTERRFLAAVHPCGCISAALVFDDRTQNADIGELFRKALERGCEFRLITGETLTMRAGWHDVPGCPNRTETLMAIDPERGP